MYYTIVGTSVSSQETQEILSRVNAAVRNARARLKQRIRSEIVMTHGSIDSLETALYNVNYLDTYIIERWRQHAPLVSKNEMDYQKWVNVGNIFIQSMSDLSAIGIEGTPSSILKQTIAKTRADIIALPKRAVRNYWPIMIGGLILYVAVRAIFSPKEE